MCKNKIEKRIELEKNIATKVKKEFENLEIINKPDICSKTHSSYKNGIYMAYKDSEILYIGMISNKLFTNLYKRFKGHGSGAHKEEWWYSEMTHVKFKEFKDYDLKVLEVVLIKFFNPIGNYTRYNINKLETLNNKFS